MAGNKPATIVVILAACVLLSGCGIFTMTPEQRAATIEFGRSLSIYGQLLASETSYVRAEVKQMRVLTVSLPDPRSVELFNQAGYTRLGEGLDQPRLEKLVALGGAAERFGNSLAKVADLNSSTADEKLFSSAARNFVLVASSIAHGLAEVSIAAPAVNLVTFVSTDAYRRRIITQTLTQAEPNVQRALARLEQEFDPNDSGSLLSVYSRATSRLSALLESSSDSFRSANLTPEERNLVATAYRVVGRNRDHIQYVTSRQLELGREAASAYDALLATFKGNEARLTDIDRFSDTVFQTDLAFKSLR